MLRAFRASPLIMVCCFHAALDEHCVTRIMHCHGSRRAKCSGNSLQRSRAFANSKSDNWRNILLLLSLVAPAVCVLFHCFPVRSVVGMRTATAASIGSIVEPVVCLPFHHGVSEWKSHSHAITSITWRVQCSVYAEPHLLGSAWTNGLLRACVNPPPLSVS
jgi:hypothetical protein